ncbi:hypothetical protein BCR43DRAFT_499553 [Syncephalastrum racemosum]|uniref:Uncharacterized protein n=1 Tax=Syncephalastrum racemosum TaxID=13706 RepID=A0A1X2H0K6_SYNRA|nr:hypothetical protein BCR43DRAFT_499553 [Syncephalastrum racemosum]
MTGLLRARVVAGTRVFYFLGLKVVVFEYPKKLKLYGAVNRWRGGSLKATRACLEAYRQPRPMLCSCPPDLQQCLLRDWDTAMRVLNKAQTANGPGLWAFETLVSIASRLKAFPEARMDTALALYFAFIASRYALPSCHKEGSACLIDLGRLLIDTPLLVAERRLFRFVLLKIAQLLTRDEEYPSALQFLQTVADTYPNPYLQQASRYFDCLAQMATLHFYLKEYDAVIDRSTPVLRFYNRSRRHVHIYTLQRLLIIRVCAFLATGRIDACIQDKVNLRIFADEFETADSREFLVALYQSVEERNHARLAEACRGLDRFQRLTDHEIAILKQMQDKL